MEEKARMQERLLMMNKKGRNPESDDIYNDNIE